MENNTFEHKLKRLEEIVKLLDNREISIEEMINLYEEGVRLVKVCRKFLEEAEQKIIDITQIETQALDDNDENVI